MHQEDQEHRWFAYFFEAKSIQAYVFEGGRLRDVVAASGLLDGLCNGNDAVLKRVLAALECPPPLFSRRAGSALMAYFRSSSERRAFRALWTLTVQMQLPGLEFVDAIGDGRTVDEAARAARIELGTRPSAHPQLPAAGPLAERAPRTGRGAVQHSDKDGFVDLPTLTKREAAGRRGREYDPLGERLGIKDANGPVRWPLDLDASEEAGGKWAFPYRKDGAELGIVHADGNGLGQLLMALADSAQGRNGEDYAKLFLDFSTCIERATMEAVSTAARSLQAIGEHRVMPARPFIVGGDDLGIIVRADLAIEFTARFLTTFEEETGKQLDEMKSHHPGLEDVLPVRMTAAAGIAFIKAHQPFYRAYDLAESLCAHAKRETRSWTAKPSGERGDPPPSALAFHRITTSTIEDYATVRQQELVVGKAGSSIAVSMQPWIVGARRNGRPHLDDLVELHRVLCGTHGEQQRSLAPATFRQILDAAITGGRVSAEERYRRWRQVVEGRDAGALQEFDELLGRVLPESDVTKTVFSGDAAACHTMLADLVTLRAIRMGEAP